MNIQVRSSFREWTVLVLAALLVGVALLTPIRSLTPATAETALPLWETIGPMAEEPEPGFG